jgi:hypothetical protein
MHDMSRGGESHIDDANYLELILRLIYMILPRPAHSLDDLFYLSCPAFSFVNLRIREFEPLLIGKYNSQPHPPPFVYAGGNVISPKEH